jgi:hypothetical protein
MSQVKIDVENFQDYRGNKYNIASVIGALLLKLLQGNGIGNSNSASGGFAFANYSGAIALANQSEDLAAANANRDRITIQNLDSTDVLLIGIGEDAIAGRSYEIDPRGVGVIEEGEANQRISILSAKTGLKFVAIARLKS